MSARLLLVGWESADWPSIHPLLDAGELPVLRRLVEGGASGALLADVPLVAPVLWTTAVTGQTPDRHGVLVPSEIDPLTGGARAPATTSRRVPAVWNILAAAGLRTHVVGWPVTHPAESLPGVVVSDAFGRPTAMPDAPWPEFPGSVLPHRVVAPLLGGRLHPGELTGEDLRPFVPNIEAIDQAADRRLVPLALALAETVTVHAAATWCLEHEPWDAAAVHYGLVSKVVRRYMRYAPPQLPGVAPEDVERYGGVVRAAYRLQDSMLGRLLALAGPATRVVVLSECGFASGSRRPAPSGEDDAEDSWPRRHGMFCMYGPGIRADALVHGARLLDVAPTVLAACDVPPAADMPGRVLLEAFLAAPDRARVPSYGATADEGPSAAGTAETLADLAAMGYTDVLDQALRRSMEHAARVSAFHLALVHISGGRPADAITLLEEALARDERQPALRLVLCWACLEAGRLDACAELLDAIAPAEADGLFVLMLRSRLLMLRGRTSAALACLRQAREVANAPAIHCLLGDAFRVSGSPAEAEDCYREALHMDGELQGAWTGLAAVLLAQQRPQEAMEAALEATGLDYGSAPAHYLLGVAWLRLGDVGRAVATLRTALEVGPSLTHATSLLARLGVPTTSD